MYSDFWKMMAMMYRHQFLSKWVRNKESRGNKKDWDTDLHVENRVPRKTAKLGV